MSSLVRKPKEEKAFSIMMNALHDRYGDAKLIPDQVDKPDYGFIWKGKRIGVEVVAIDNHIILESINAHESERLNKARKQELNAINTLQPYTRYNETTVPNSEFVSKSLAKKLELYNSYIANFDEVFLLIHCETYENPKFLELLKIVANNYLLDNKCLFSKVYLVDLRRSFFVGKVFDFKNKKREKIPYKLSNLKSETRVSHFLPVGQEFNIYEKYNNQM